MTTTELRPPGYVVGSWTVDPVHSYVGFAIKHMMVSRVRGHFTSFSAQLTTTEAPLGSQVSASIDVSSIDTNNALRDDHIRSADFFDAANHPTMTFRSAGIRMEQGRYYIDGDLTIRGVTRPITLVAEPPEFGHGPDGGVKAGISATAEINRSDFGVSYNGPIPGGGRALGERVQIVLDIEADLNA
ncbi:MAG TPA: YceI family protein [Jatrophihabitantaceae bacterium]|jgi:polyisoprenoid-binding protein YceI